MTMAASHAGAIDGRTAAAGAIADALGATEGTIKNHVSAILGKLGVRSRPQAMLKGIELGYRYMSRP